MGGEASTDRAFAIADIRFPTRLSTAQSPLARGSARPCPARPREPPENRPPKSRADRAQARVRRGSSFASLRRATITRLRLLHFDRADPSLDRANRIMSVPNDA